MLSRLSETFRQTSLGTENSGLKSKFHLFKMHLNLCSPFFHEKGQFWCPQQEETEKFSRPLFKKSGLARPKGLLQRKNYFLLIHFGCHSLGQKKKFFLSSKWKSISVKKTFFALNLKEKGSLTPFVLLMFWTVTKQYWVIRPKLLPKQIRA